MYVKQRERFNASRCYENKFERFFGKDQSQEKMVLFQEWGHSTVQCGDPEEISENFE